MKVCNFNPHPTLICFCTPARVFILNITILYLTLVNLLFNNRKETFFFQVRRVSNPDTEPSHPNTPLCKIIKNNHSKSTYFALRVHTLPCRLLYYAEMQEIIKSNFIGLK